MHRTVHPAAVLPAEADKPRVVIDCAGLNAGIQVLDARTRLQVVLTGDPPRGVKGCLRLGGFRPISDHVWDAPHTPATIFTAQDIVKTFFESDGNA